MNQQQTRGDRVLSIGDALVDLSTHVSNIPVAGGCTWGSAVNLSPGGASANVAANTSRLGIGSAFLGCVGDDYYGHYLLDAFTQCGVDTTLTHVLTGAFTGIVFALVDSCGERTFVPCALGAAHTQLSHDQVRQVDYSAFRLVHACGVCLVESPSREALIKALRLAKDQGTPTYYDLNLRLDAGIFTDPYREAQWAAVEAASVVLAGDYELTQLAQSEDWLKAARLVLERGPEWIIVKRGMDGAVALSEDEQIVSPAFQVVAVDATGAGDAFDAGFIAATVRGLDMPSALVYANAVGALKVMHNGSRISFGHQAVEVFLHQNARTCLQTRATSKS